MLLRKAHTAINNNSNSSCELVKVYSLPVLVIDASSGSPKEFCKKEAITVNNITYNIPIIIVNSFMNRVATD